MARPGIVLDLVASASMAWDWQGKESMGWGARADYTRPEVQYFASHVEHYYWYLEVRSIHLDTGKSSGSALESVRHADSQTPEGLVQLVD